MDLVAPCQSFKCFIDNLDTNEPGLWLALRLRQSKRDLHQEDAICKTSESVHLAVSIREPGAGGPFAHDCSA